MKKSACYKMQRQNVLWLLGPKIRCAGVCGGVAAQRILETTERKSGKNLFSWTVPFAISVKPRTKLKNQERWVGSRSKKNGGAAVHHR
jgi:hypothetical protein